MPHTTHTIGYDALFGFDSRGEAPLTHGEKSVLVPRHIRVRLAVLFRIKAVRGKIALFYRVLQLLWWALVKIILQVKWINRQRVLVFAARGINHRHRHLMEDIKRLMPHHKTESKLERSKNLYVVNEISEMKNCNKCILFEGRKMRDLYLWMANIPNGPSAKFLVENSKLILKLTALVLYFSLSTQHKHNLISCLYYPKEYTAEAPAKLHLYFSLHNG